jgi:hypothetical protein
VKNPMTKRTNANDATWKAIVPHSLTTLLASRR